MVICFLSAIYIFYFTLLFKVNSQKKQSKNFYVKHKIIFVIPALNEGKVIKNTVNNLLNILDSEDISIYAINDGSDDNTLSELESIKDTRLNIINRQFPDCKKGKGEALNYTFKQIIKDCFKGKIQLKNTIIGIIDADSKLSYDAINQINITFSNQKIGAMQGTVRMINTKSILEKLQDLEFLTANVRTQNIRMYEDRACLGGNAQFTRLQTLSDVIDERGSAWSKCLLEDFELSYQILKNDWLIVHNTDITVYQQALKSYKKLVKQRSRWVQGNIQCRVFFKEIIQNKKFPLVTKLDLLYFLIQPYLNLFSTVIIAFLYVFLALYLYIFKTTLDFASLSVFVLISLLPTIMLVIDYKNSLKKYDEALQIITMIKLVLFNYIYCFILFPAIYKGFVNEAKGISTWDKTERF
ncbi:MAG: glycosyltransferase [Patescibacteria group bacterium]